MVILFRVYFVCSDELYDILFVIGRFVFGNNEEIEDEMEDFVINEVYEMEILMIVKLVM